jgi:hypothetical protein
LPCFGGLTIYRCVGALIRQDLLDLLGSGNNPASMPAIFMDWTRGQISRGIRSVRKLPAERKKDA